MLKFGEPLILIIVIVLVVELKDVKVVDGSDLKVVLLIVF